MKRLRKESSGTAWLLFDTDLMFLREFPARSRRRAVNGGCQQRMMLQCRRECTLKDIVWNLSAKPQTNETMARERDTVPVQHEFFKRSQWK